MTATVTDRNGRFVSGLRKEDFRLFEDGVEQPITHFNAERVPVSLGSSSTPAAAWTAKSGSPRRRALNRFLFELLDRDDEVFLYRFDNRPELVEGWTTDRRRIARGARTHPAARRHLALRRGRRGDAAGADRPEPEEGAGRDLGRQRHATVATTLPELKQMIRETEMLVYASGSTP